MFPLFWIRTQRVGEDPGTTTILFFPFPHHLFLPGVWSLGQGCNYSARRRNFYSPGLRALSVAHGPGAASTAVPGVATPLTGSSSLGLWWLDGGGGGRSSCRHTTPRGSVRASRDAEPVPGVLSLDPPGGAPYLLEG